MADQKPRAWDEGDPEPADHPPFVDSDGVTWVWEVNEFGDPEDPPSWVQKLFTHHVKSDGTVGAVSGGLMFMEWDEILADFGPVREATADEAATVTHCWPGQNLLGGAA